jgi:hypothetical protein
MNYRTPCTGIQYLSRFSGLYALESLFPKCGSCPFILTLKGKIQCLTHTSLWRTAEDGKRLRIVARQHGASRVLLAAWLKGTAARFFLLLRKKAKNGVPDWTEIDELDHSSLNN